MSIPPSGQQVRLAAGDTEAVVVEVGGGLRSFSVGGRDVIDGYDEAARANGGRGQVLVPWPNRLRDGQWTWRGSEQQLPLSEAPLHNASHGLVRWQTWAARDVTPTSASLSTLLPQQPGYPFQLKVTTTYLVAPSSLTVTLGIENLSEGDAPVGMGMHPYLSVGTTFVDEARLTLPGDDGADGRRAPAADRRDPQRRLGRSHRGRRHQHRVRWSHA